MPDIEKKSIDLATQEVLKKAKDENIKTAWDRLESQEPQCGFGQLGLCCTVCNMGPCRIDPFGEGAQVGVCGANADTIAARNLARKIAVGASAHSDHGRDVAHTLSLLSEGHAHDYEILDIEKLKNLAEEFGIDTNKPAGSGLASDSQSHISQKDIGDISFCEEHGLEYIAQSFVRDKNDILDVRNLLKPNSKCKVIAKIENREGIKNIDEILTVSDGIMIARGDMGVSLPIHEIPIIQKLIIKKCNRAGKFVITATQMLESMTENLRPTRAEATDVANAIIDGTNYVMLSAESAVGKYPAETVATMNNIIRFTERSLGELI